uniref:Uncharacterized protein n=1 Tax=Rhizophora mucronata TaxID=61149 RepID=A0A2P2NXU6_RHIMU
MPLLHWSENCYTHIFMIENISNNNCFRINMQKTAMVCWRKKKIEDISKPAC